MPLPLAAVGAGLAGAFVGGLASSAVQIVLKVMAALGFGYIAYSGIDVLVTQSEAQVLTLLQGVPPITLQLFGALQIGTCIKIAFSALVIRLTLAGLIGGVLKSLRITA